MKKKQKRTLPLEVANLWSGAGMGEINMLAIAKDCLLQASSTPADERKIITPLHPEGVFSDERQFAESIFVDEAYGQLGFSDYELITSTKYIFTVSHWSDYKEIFSFSKEMVDILSEGTDGSSDIPSSVLHLLPFPCLYVEMEGQQENGFFADLFDDYLRIIFLKESEEIEYRYFEFDLSADNGNIKEALHSQTNMTRKSLQNLGIDKKVIEDFPPETMATAFSLLVYICCMNAELKESAETVSLHGPEGRSKEQIASSSFRSVRKWTAGEEITRKIKAYNRTRRGKSTNDVKNGSSKRPHIRSAHFHHYWTGKKDGSEERTLIVKWLQPTFINGDGGDITVKRTEIVE